MITVADIAKQAFDAASQAVDGIVFEATLTYQRIAGAYDRDTGSYGDDTTSTDACRVIVGQSTPYGSTDDYELQPNEKVISVQGLTVLPEPDMSISFGGHTYTIKQVNDVLDAHGLYTMVIR